ncbi:MAG: hypothetical protein ACTSX4_04040 [Candidatus Helarchaeota archaeon]
MKKNKRNLKIAKKPGKNHFHVLKTQKKKAIFKEKIPQKTLDVFTKDESEIKPTFYDEDFTSEDFKEITKNWSKKNLE